MPGFSHFPELLIILVLALIVFGPKRLPEVGSAVGKGLREFRRATSELEDAMLRPADEEPDPFGMEPEQAVPASEAESAPAIDTLATRRAQRQMAREAAAQTVEGVGEIDQAHNPGA